LKPITFDQKSYYIGGKPVFLYSGEIHYFRVPKSDWRRRMQLFKKAGGNCIATYIPWLIHEPEEGKFVFGGKNGMWDLEGWLKIAEEVGLYVIARPGPYQYSELKYSGLPVWLCEKYPQLAAKNQNGKPLGPGSISYVHPLFWEKVRRWFGVIGPLLAKHTVSNGGPIAFTQLDNELTGIHFWAGGLDYNEESMGFGCSDGRYTRFLKTRYATISDLNRDYEAADRSFEDVRPNDDAKAGHRAGTLKRRDYLHFYLETAGEYLRFLADELRACGIDTPFVHNSANANMNSLFLESLKKFKGDFLLGSDHYYNLNQDWRQNNPTPQYALDVFQSLEMLRLMGFPPTVFEMPSGSCSDWPPITPEDSRACYRMHLALGTKGVNYYIFTGGPNPTGCGITTDVYDYNAPIAADGKIRPLYQVQKDFGRLLRSRKWLAEARREYDFRITFDFESTRAGRYWKSKGDFLLTPNDALTFQRKGVLTSAFCAGLSPAFCNLDADDWTGDKGTPVLVCASACMSAEKQRRIVRFLKSGGQALIAPVLPTHDENLKPCAILADFLGGPLCRLAGNDPVRVTITDVQNIFKNGEVFFWERLRAKAKIIGKDEYGGKTIAWQNGIPGGGRVIVLGFKWSHAMREHERMIFALLSRLNLTPRIRSDNPNVWASLLTHGKQSALFLLNLHSASQSARVSCRPAWSKKLIEIGRHDLKPMTVKMIELS
jgi:beta-galactosidase